LLALICVEIRAILIYLRFIDCSFGFFVAIPMVYGLQQVKKMRKVQ